MREETYKAQNVDEIVWLRLNRLKSIKLCEKLLRKKLNIHSNPQITESIINSKAKGLASAVENAIGYWETNPKSLNAKILSRYYFLLQMTIAEQVSNIKNLDDLKKVQKHTENGHGLGTIINPNTNFPDNYFTFSIRSGHFYSYLKSLGINTKEFDFEKRPRKFNEITEIDKVVNLLDLFRRIPELNNVIEEYTDEPPLCFHIGYSMGNNLDIERDFFNFNKKEKITETKQNEISFLSIYSESESVNEVYLKSLNLPFSDYSVKRDNNSNERIISLKFEHPINTIWHNNLKLYSSTYSPSTFVVPLWGEIKDNIVINYVLLYTLSIIVRYLPDLWSEITSGELNHIGSLIEYYISIIDHILPLEMLERITESNISIHQPGSIFGPM